MGQPRQDEGVTVVPPRALARVDEQLSRIGLRGPLTRDCALAVVLTAVTAALLVPMLQAQVAGRTDAFLVPLTSRQAGVILAAATAQSLILCVRRVQPVICLTAVAALQLVITAAAPPELILRLIAPFVAAYTLGTLRTTRRATSVAGVVVLLEGGLAVVLTAGAAPLGTLLLSHLGQALFTYGAATFLGVYVRTRRRYLYLLGQQAAEALRSREAAVDRAISIERRGIARELHDVAAHHLSGMVVQTAAVQRLIDQDPEAAKEANAWIRSQGKETLADLRSVVGLLRDDQDEGGRSPAPGLASLQDLVDTATRLGAQVELTSVGPPVDLPPLADISMYRIAQEALTNARQHAPGPPVQVALTNADGQVTLQVVSRLVGQERTGASGVVAAEHPQVSHRSGAGILGMRERARLVGARLRVGPDDQGGWLVQVDLATPPQEGALT